VGAKRLRERYLEAVLRQDIAFFDDVGAGAVATHIQTDTRGYFSVISIGQCISVVSTDLVQQGTSEKLAICLVYLSSFVTGFILAYIRNWRLALAMSSVVPCISIMGAVMNRHVSKYMQMSRQYVADGGNLAEEVISTICTAKAFGTQKALADIYDTHIDKSNKADNGSAIWRGTGFATFFFVPYSAYSLAFSFGTTLINEGHGQE
jgi:ATP-binding cassette subfamily B (MDR/TAP) protein 1